MATLSPVSSYRPDMRPRTTTSTSRMSIRSGRSSGSANKMDLTESPRDKKRLNTKADPSLALNEAQPIDMALEQSNLDDIRLLQHKDFDGNVIMDPDRSNPTRHRLERPLDTIRSFNAAAEGTTTRRTSFQNRPSPGFASNGQENRRSSYYGNGNFANQQRPRPGMGGYYRNSSYGMRPESYIEEPQPPNPPYGRPARQQNQPSQPYHNYGESPSSAHSYQQSYETVTSGSDEYGKSTNPSSQNSSFDRLHQMQSRKMEDGGPYDNEMQYNPPMNNGYMSNGGYNAAYNSQNGNLPRPQQYGGPPPSGPSNSRRPIQLTTASSGPPPTQADLNKALPPKRQSWLKRRFSKRDP